MSEDEAPHWLPGQRRSQWEERDARESHLPPPHPQHSPPLDYCCGCYVKGGCTFTVSVCFLGCKGVSDGPMLENEQCRGSSVQVLGFTKSNAPPRRVTNSDAPRTLGPPARARGLRGARPTRRPPTGCSSPAAGAGSCSGGDGGSEALQCRSRLGEPQQSFAKGVNPAECGSWGAARLARGIGRAPGALPGSPRGSEIAPSTLRFR